MGTNWKRWFEAYAANWASGEVRGVALRYAETFMNVKPGKRAVYRNDHAFLAWLERVRGFHLEAGLEKVEIVTTRAVTLGDDHALVSVLWAVQFHKTQALRIQFEISYLVAEPDTDWPKIVTIVSHEDQRDAMRRYGVLPG
jgi:hypothetical protein